MVGAAISPELSRRKPCSATSSFCSSIVTSLSLRQLWHLSLQLLNLRSTTANTQFPHCRAAD